MNTVPSQQSEVARLLHAIDQAYEAAHQGLDGPAIVGPHRRRTTCTEAIAQAFAQLQPLVGGPDRAMHLLDAHLTTAKKEGSCDDTRDTIDIH